MKLAPRPISTRPPAEDEKEPGNVRGTPTRGKNMVAVCDILAFTKLVRDHELSTVVDDAIGWFRQALGHSMLHGDFPAAPPSLRKLNAHARVGVAMFSDTLLFYTKEDT